MKNLSIDEKQYWNGFERGQPTTPTPEITVTYKDAFGVRLGIEFRINEATMLMLLTHLPSGNLQETANVGFIVFSDDGPQKRGELIIEDAEMLGRSIMYIIDGHPLLSPRKRLNLERERVKTVLAMLEQDFPG